MPEEPIKDIDFTLQEPHTAVVIEIKHHFKDRASLAAMLRNIAQGVEVGNTAWIYGT